MSYFTQPITVLTFTHRDHDVQIQKVMVGATCCTIEHYPRLRACTVCKNPLEHELKFFPVIDGEMRTDLSEDTEEDAAECAMEEIDEMSDEEDSAKREESVAIVLGAMPPAPHDGHGNAAFEPPNEAADQMVKLGWPEKAMAIVAANPKK